MLWFWASITAVIALVSAGLLTPGDSVTLTVPVHQVADASGEFIEADGMWLYTRSSGAGENLVLLLHGFGASTFSWRDVMQPLSHVGAHVVAYDRPGFGLTPTPSIPSAWGSNPYGLEAQINAIFALMDRLGAPQATLIAHSAGGQVASLAALQHPERIKALVLVAPALQPQNPIPAWIRPLLHTSLATHLGPWFVRTMHNQVEAALRLAWHDTSKVTPAIVEGYQKPFQGEGWDTRLWEWVRTSEHFPTHRLTDITVPTLVVAGDDDRIIPTKQSHDVAAIIPDAAYTEIPVCGHLPHEEVPDAFLTAVGEFLRQHGVIP